MFLLAPAVRAGAVPQERTLGTVSRRRPHCPPTERNDHSLNSNDRFELSYACSWLFPGNARFRP